jgi:hypothetical protein
MEAEMKILFGVGLLVFIVFLYALIWALCKAAGETDDYIARHGGHDDEE